MEFLPSKFILQDYEKALEATQKEKRRIKTNIHHKRLQATQAFEEADSSVQIDSNKSLKDLEDDYHKIYMSKIYLAEKLEFTIQIHRLLFGTNDTQQLQKSDEPKPFIGKREEEAWIKDMQNLDMEFLNTPYAIQKMTNVYENDETDKILTKWYWQLKVYLRDDPAEKNLTCSELLLIDVIAYDIAYNCNKPMTKVLNFSTRRSGHVVQVYVSSVEDENGPHFKINFDFPLIKSINKFHNILQVEKVSSGLDFPNFIKHIVWNEMSELFF